MKLVIVYDNEVYKKDSGLKSDWGFSCFIATDKENILFDTGANGEILLSNMGKLGINPRGISKIVISHEHHDHNGGLEALADVGVKATLFRTSNVHTSENFNIITVTKPMEIGEKVYTIGRLSNFIPEQSLVLKGEKGFYVLVGCSHPGVKEILNAAKNYGNIVGLIGGFHGFNNFPVLKDLELICVCHCTQHKKEIKKLFPRACIDCGVGRIIDI